MSLPVVSERLVEQYARTLVGKSGRASQSRVLALRAQPSWQGPPSITIAVDDSQHRVSVRPCESSLAVREALLDAGHDEYLIVLTDRPDADLGLDILGRCFNQTVVPVDLWSAVLALFSARALDPRLRKLSWAQEPLLERAPAGGWPTAVSGTVTVRHALSHLTASILGIPAEQLDASGLLQWTLDPHGRSEWQQQPDAVKQGLRDWVRDEYGEVAALALRIASMPHQVDAVSLGVVADVLWPASGPASPEALQARIRLEQFTGVPNMPAELARAWAEASLSVLLRLADDLDPQARTAVLARASSAFPDLQWPEGSALSTVLHEGYDYRLRLLAAAVSEAVADAGAAAGVEPAFADLLAHDMAPHDRRTSVARMAVRLVRWLATPDDVEPTNVTTALDRHMASDAWVDLASADVWVGSSDPDVAAAWSVLDTAVRARRRAHDSRTALLLADATAAGVLPRATTPVERLVPDLVRPLAASAQVLLIVVDGMSAAVAAEVADGALTSGWIEVVKEHRLARGSVLAVLPTLTKYSRTSLFSGELRTGTQNTEKSLFPAISGGGEVFHKSDLVGAAGEELPAAVRQSIASSKPIVAVVLNTVDDALAKHDPGGTDWNLDSIRHLRSLLERAAQAGRTVVLTSDHGHVVERGSTARSYAGAEARFRPVSSGPVNAGSEIELRGPRVLAKDGAIVAAWGEDLRYGIKQAGYHGGSSAAEVVIPVVVLTRQPDQLVGSGWVPAPPQAPQWWNDPVRASQPGATVTAPARRPRAEVAGQETLLSLPEVSTAGPASTDYEGLVAELMSGEVYAVQRSRAGARALEDDRVAAMVSALMASSGRLHRDTLAAAAGIPAHRIGPTLIALRRQLNIEGYDVVSMDADQVTVLLDATLLREQFGLEG